MSKQARIEFRLTMPNVGSWNGQWSGEGANYTLVRSMDLLRISRLQIPQSWYYSFGDGWGANVSARVMGKGERRKPSSGFCGYEWMVESIVKHGRILAGHEAAATQGGAK